MNLATSFLERLNRVNATHEAVSLIKEVGRQCGLEKIRIVPHLEGSNKPRQGHLLDLAMGWPLAWVDQISRLEVDIAATNPTTCQDNFRPFLWRLTEEGRKWNGKKIDGAAYMAARHWIKEVSAGITTPVVSLRGQHGYVAWMTNAADADLEAIYFRAARSLFVIAHYLVEFFAFWPEENWHCEQAPMLTEREQECLHWVALGKTDEEISALMLRSTSTIRFHVKNVLRKLGAQNRAHAVGITHRHELAGGGALRRMNDVLPNELRDAC